MLGLYLCIIAMPIGARNTEFNHYLAEQNLIRL
jgi:hypothetical protein